MRTWICNGMLICAVAVLLCLPTMVNAKSNEQVIDGGEGFLDATHPAVHALGDTVVCVWTKERQILNPEGDWIKNIHIAFSYNNGMSWQQYEWVSPETDAEQDFADVRIFYDWTLYPDGDYIRVVVVWQERSVEGGNWVIKVAERDNPNYNGLWTYHGIISETNCDNALPKVDTMSYASQGQPPAYTYWHFVWQRKYDTGTYGIDMMTNRRDIYSDNWMASPRTIVAPASNYWNYLHPAVATNLIGNSFDSEVHIVYHSIRPISPPQRIVSVSGQVFSWGSVRFSSYYTIMIDSSQSPTLGVPDICSYGIGPNAVVDVVYYTGGSVGHKRSLNSGFLYGSYSTPIPSCSNQFRSVAVYSDTYQNSYQISVVSSGGGILYFTKYQNGNWLVPQQWTTVGVNEYVDVCLPSPLTYSHVVWMRDQSAIYYARDP